MHIIVGLISVLMLSLASGPVCAQDKSTLVEQALDNIEGSAKEEVSPDIVVELSEEETPAPDDAGVESKYKLVASDKPIIIRDLNFKNDDIRDALYQMEKKSGLIMIIDYDVKGTASLQVSEINIWDALKAVLEENNLAYSEEYGIVRVMTIKTFEEKFGYSFGGGTVSHIARLRYVKPNVLLSQLNSYKSEEGRIIVDEKFNTMVLIDSARHLDRMVELIVELDVPFETEVFYLRFAMVQNIKKNIEKILTPGAGRISVDTRTNKVVVTDTPQKIKEITTLVQDLDKKIDVLIGMQVYEIRLSEEHSKGVDWEAIIGDYQSMVLTRQGENPPDSQKLSVGTITGEDYQILLEALETVGESKKLKDAELTVTVNQGSYISYNSKALLAVDAGSSPDENPDDDEEESDFGFDMKIVPQLKSEGDLVVSLQPELQFASNRADEKGNHHDTFSFQGDIVVKVKKGEVIVLGGIVQNRKVTKVSKFPLLGDIPLLGTVFKRSGRADERTEYVVFLTQEIENQGQKVSGL